MRATYSQILPRKRVKCPCGVIHLPKADAVDKLCGGCRENALVIRLAPAGYDVPENGVEGSRQHWSLSDDRYADLPARFLDVQAEIAEPVAAARRSQAVA